MASKREQKKARQGDELAQWHELVDEVRSNQVPLACQEHWTEDVAEVCAVINTTRKTNAELEERIRLMDDRFTHMKARVIGVLNESRSED